MGAVHSALELPRAVALVLRRPGPVHQNPAVLGNSIYRNFDAVAPIAVVGQARRPLNL